MPTTDSNESASARRDAEFRQFTAFEHLCSRPGERAEAIARHYANMAPYAAVLRKMIELYRYAPESNPCTEAAIACHLRTIKDAHRFDLGIELAWPTSALAGFPGIQTYKELHPHG